MNVDFNQITNNNSQKLEKKNNSNLESTTLSSHSNSISLSSTSQL